MWRALHGHCKYRNVLRHSTFEQNACEILNCLCSLAKNVWYSSCFVSLPTLMYVCQRIWPAPTYQKCTCSNNTIHVYTAGGCYMILTWYFAPTMPPTPRPYLGTLHGCLRSWGHSRARTVDPSLGSRWRTSMATGRMTPLPGGRTCSFCTRSADKASCVFGLFTSQYSPP